MLAFAHFDAGLLLNSLVSLLVAFVLGGLIGFERQYRQRTAGLRTNVLVAVGAAAGASLIAEAVLGAVFVLSANTLLRPIVNAIVKKLSDTPIINQAFWNPSTTE